MMIPSMFFRETVRELLCRPRTAVLDSARKGKKWRKAVAEGLDFPFGGLGEDGSGAGVLATVVQGEIKIKE